MQRAIDWARRNLFSSVFNTLLTLVVLALAGLVLPPVFRWAVTHATISGMTRAACTGDGACWTFIRVRFPLFIYGKLSQPRVLARRSRLRPAGGVLLPRCCATGCGIAGCWLLLLLIVFPVLAASCWPAGCLGLAYVDT